MSILVNDKEVSYKEGLRAIDLVENGNKSVISCKINHKLRDLSYAINDGDKVDLLGLCDGDSIRVYEASLRYLVAMAAKKVFPSMKLNCDYYISRSICFKKNEGEFNEEEVSLINEKVKEIVEKDYPFIRKTI